ncbi:MAG: SDR family oxidoreductase [Cytophagales bacterium]|nr:SDR family oxidoreductase [Cytophagales bacterium]
MKQANKLIVVSGGSRGIGRAILEQFGHEGFELATCSRGEAQLQALKEHLGQVLPGTRLHTQVADLSKKEDALAFARYVQELGLPVDVLVNNAGQFVPGQIQTEADGVLEQLLATNLSSAYHLTRALLPAMKARGSGHIFTMCSTASLVPYTNGGSYCISKFALLGFTKVLRAELLDENIRVTAILPGATLTSSWEGVALPPERFMRAEDVASAVWAAYSLSPQSVVEELLIRPQQGDL